MRLRAECFDTFRVQTTVQTGVYAKVSRAAGATVGLAAASADVLRCRPLLRRRHDDAEQRLLPILRMTKADQLTLRMADASVPRLTVQLLCSKSGERQVKRAQRCLTLARPC